MLSVLIVDDQVQIRQLIRDALEGAGYHVERLVTEKRDLSATANHPLTLSLWISLCRIRMD